MKRFLFGAGVALVLALLSGFTLLSLAVQTQRVRWDTFLAGQTAPRAGVFGNPFTGSADYTGAVSYGPAGWRLGGLQCLIIGAGTTDGGTNSLKLDVVHEDAGVDCECDLGAASCLGNNSFACVCPGGITELAGVKWGMQFGSGSTCAAMPGNGSGYDVFCSADLFR